MRSNERHRLGHAATVATLCLTTLLASCAEPADVHSPANTQNPQQQQQQQTATHQAPDPEASAIRLTDLVGAPHAPIERSRTRPVLIVFLLTDCPIANAYAPEIRSIQEDFSKTCDTYLVYVESDLGLAAAKGHARDYNLPAPLLLDPAKRLVKAVGATMTPEAVILQAGEVVYRGRIDNWYAALGKRRRKATRHDLRDALAAVRDGTPIATARTQAVGCFIPDGD